MVCPFFLSSATVVFISVMVCGQEAQAMLLAKDDELTMLKRDLHHLRAQAKQKAQESAAQPSSAQPSATQASGAHESATQAQAQAKALSSRPEEEASRSKKVGSAAGVGESGLPSPSLPATPHSPGASPRGS